jgi:hypothetical protein
MHLVFLVEEPSAEVFLAGLLPRILPEGMTHEINRFQGKSDLLANLESRLRGYSAWIPSDWRIVVLVDEDREDCGLLKRRLETSAKAAGLTTKSRGNNGTFAVLNRIAVEELEAWFLGDVEALRTVYPRVPASLASRKNLRDPDAVPGGTWEALERVLQQAGYFPGGLGKLEVSRAMGRHLEPSRNRSRSFACFIDGISALHRAQP